MVLRGQRLQRRSERRPAHAADDDRHQRWHLVIGARRSRAGACELREVGLVCPDGQRAGEARELRVAVFAGPASARVVVQTREMREPKGVLAVPDVDVELRRVEADDALARQQRLDHFRVFAAPQRRIGRQVADAGKDRTFPGARARYRQAACLGPPECPAPQQAGGRPGRDQRRELHLDPLRSVEVVVVPLANVLAACIGDRDVAQFTQRTLAGGDLHQPQARIRQREDVGAQVATGIVDDDDELPIGVRLPQEALHGVAARKQPAAAHHQAGHQRTVRRWRQWRDLDRAVGIARGVQQCSVHGSGDG